MSGPPCTVALALPDPEATDALGRLLARHLGPGDVLALEGPVGAGKSHLARALIREALGAAVDVPSPSFTLVQTYDRPDGSEIWHADLYRLTHPDEATELGLEAAFDQALCLVEWPDRLGTRLPTRTHRLSLTPEGEGRLCRLSTFDDALATALAAHANDARAATRARLLDRAGWGTARAGFLAGDASDRSYDRLSRADGTSAVLMDAPPGKGEDLGAFIRIADWLRAAGISAPAVLARDMAQGYLLLEDLGDGLFARLLADGAADEVTLYRAAADVLHHLHRLPAPRGLPHLSPRDWAEAAGFALDWYAMAATGHAPDKTRFTDCLEALLCTHADAPPVVILRDFHAENLLWLPGRSGLARVGVLDFQLAQMGQPGYDIVSLIEDARRDVSPAAAEAVLDAHARARGLGREALAPGLAVLSAQRALRILGIFARLCLVSGKTGYLRLLPRVWGQLGRALDHPALAELSGICHSLLPAPDKRIQDRICSQAGTMR